MISTMPRLLRPECNDQSLHDHRGASVFVKQLGGVWSWLAGGGSGK
jgi:hypothetical protein